MFTDHAAAYLEAEVIQDVDVGTHTIFIGRIVAAEVLSEDVCMTYDYYHQVKRGRTPETAPSYIANEKGGAQASWINGNARSAATSTTRRMGDPDGGIAAGTSFEDIPDDWVCPVCGADKSAFVKVA